MNYLLADELADEKYSADSAQDTQLGSLGSRQGEDHRTARWEDLDSSSASSLQCSGQAVYKVAGQSTTPDWVTVSLWKNGAYTVHGLGHLSCHNNIVKGTKCL